MKNYQILTLIGCILGLLIIFSAYTLAFILFDISGSTEKMTPEFSIQVGIGIIALIISLAIVFAIKNVHMVGIILIICAIVVIFAHGLFGVIGFALLLPAGIIALRQKKENEDISKI